MQKYKAKMIEFNLFQCKKSGFLRASLYYDWEI
jgi:hypothetical protein